MSFGDPNNPYGQQPQGQPGYGYPQQAPQGGYGYPQQGQQAYPAYPGGGFPAPGGQVPMPGGVKAARVILYILGILQALMGVLMLLGGAFFASLFADSSSSTASDAGAVAGGVFAVLGIVFIAFALWPILTAAKMAKGRGGVRGSGIAFGAVQTLFAGFSVLSNVVALGSSDGAPAIALSMVFSVISLALGIWIIVGLANAAASSYFGRPQY
ncbi:hypothetical protein SUDANB120_03824 [Streptomyces sp. enrichment culture]|uniref:hypothetical protein n=1 Tax=Streptomyces sp. enrichment culture TaxID=1795815 RepID=UPI003F55E9BC